MPTNKFHYIWMGSVLPKYEDAFKDGPNDLARQLRELINHSNDGAVTPQNNPQNQEIIMWVPEDIIDDIRERNLLDPLITLKPIEDIYQNSKHLKRDELDKLKRSVDVLGDHKAYSAQKDVLSAAILEEHGGYYFDTTTQIESISSLMDNQPNEIWLPTIMIHNTHYDGSEYDYHGKLSYYTSYVKRGKESTFSEPAYIPDVWALHSSKPGQGFFRSMMNNYTQKCQYYFPEAFDNKHISESLYTMSLDGHSMPKSGYMLGDEGSGTQIMQNHERDTFIGQLVIYSLLDAVTHKYGSPSDEVMENLSSPAMDKSDHKLVESMGVKKFHNGIWRTSEVTTRMDHSISTYAIQEPVAQIEVATEKSQDRTHLLPVRAAGFKDIKLKYQQMRGDALKREIISDFRKQIAEIDSIEALNLFVKDFKSSVSYDVLKTGQGVASKLGVREPGSVETINSIVREKALDLEQAKSTHGLNK